MSALLAAVGIYGVLAHWFGSRTRELGVRFALGATRGSIAGLVMREAVLATASGTGVGFALAIAAVRLTGSALLGVPSLETRALVLVAGGIFAVTLAAPPSARHGAPRALMSPSCFVSSKKLRHGLQLRSPTCAGRDWNQ